MRIDAGLLRSLCAVAIQFEPIHLNGRPMHNFDGVYARHSREYLSRKAQVTHLLRTGSNEASATAERKSSRVICDILARLLFNQAHFIESVPASGLERSVENDKDSDDRRYCRSRRSPRARRAAP